MIDFKKIDSIFSKAEADGRDFLLEQEVYAMLRLAGIATPRHKFIPVGKKLSASDVASFKSDGLVLKIVAPLIQHKTDVGGVAFVKASASAANAAISKMYADIPARFFAWAKSHSHGVAPSSSSSPAASSSSSGLPANLNLASVSADIRGVLVCEKVDFEKFGFGSELLLGARNSREFGPVVTMGAGRRRSRISRRPPQRRHGRRYGLRPLLEPSKILSHLAPIAVYDKLVKPFRGKPAPLKTAELQATYERFQALAAHYSPFKSSRYVIEEIEVNPFVVRSGRLLPLDGLCRFSRAHVDIKNRPVDGIKHLLKPAVHRHHRRLREDEPRPYHPQ